VEKDEIRKLRSEGFTPLKTKGYFRIRIISKAGKMTAEDMKYICYISEKYGKGYMSFTTRLCVEIPWIKYEDIDSIKADINKFNLLLLKSGQNLRPVVTCKGAICGNGIIDAEDIGNKIFDKYKDYKLPGRFKIGIVGCPNNCLQVQSEDFGIVGQRVPKVIEGKCRNCGLCIKNCRKNAISIENSKPIIDNLKCINCGKCIEGCKFGGIVEKDIGVSIYLGGKLIELQNREGVASSIFSLEEMELFLKHTMDFYNKYGKTKEKFKVMLSRLGTERCIESIVKMTRRNISKSYFF